MADGQVAYVGASAGSLLVVLAVPLLPPLFGRKHLAFRRQFRLPIDHKFRSSGKRYHTCRFRSLGSHDQNMHRSSRCIAIGEICSACSCVGSLQAKLESRKA